MIFQLHYYSDCYPILYTFFSDFNVHSIITAHTKIKILEFFVLIYLIYIYIYIFFFFLLYFFIIYFDEMSLTS
jgi:hypothetical protein